MPDPISPWRPIATDRFIIGAAFYPEHEDDATLARDAALMAEAGIDVVRMGEFAWSIVEPEEGRFDFAFFDRAIAVLGDHGIDTILCTPTATPPRWLTHRHSETLRVDAQGRTMRHGSRQHGDPTSPVLREHSRRITAALADHYRGHPRVIGWQTDNEFNTSTFETHSESAQTAFREWLRDRYGSIETLNEAWGTSFWNRRYDDFDQIETPIHHSPAHADPSHMLDYRRFLAAATAAFQHDQVEILRAANPRWFVYHNVGYLRGMDLRGQFGRDLDFIGPDTYPFLVDEMLRLGLAYCQSVQQALTRGWGGNFIVPEQQTGFVGQTDFSTAAPEPGEMRRMAMSSIANGADGLLFFRWRTARFGAESYWMGVLDHDGVPRRRFCELKELTAEIRALAPRVLGTSVRIDVGIAACSYDNEAAQEVHGLGLPGILPASIPLHAVCYNLNVPCGFVAPDDDLDRLKILFVPHLLHWDAAWTAALTRFVERGGVAIIGCRSGTRDARNHVIRDTPPGPLADLCGVTVEEYGRLPAPGATALLVREAYGGGSLDAGQRTSEAAGRTQQLVIGEAKLPAAHWYEVLDPREGTEVIARWSDRALAGRPAITRRTVGRGAAIYVGTYLTPESAFALIAPLLQPLGITPPFALPKDVESSVREGQGRTLRFLTNSTNVPQVVGAPDGDLTLEPYGCAVIER